MPKLILDTSTNYIILALAEGGEVLSEQFFKTSHLSETLLPSIQKLLGEKRPEAIAVGIGPGSFAGTRTAVTVAQSLSFAWDLPLIPFPSPLAFIPAEHKGLFSIVLDAKMGQAALIEGDTKRGILSTQLMAPEDLPSRPLLYPGCPSLKHVALFIEGKETQVAPSVEYLRC